MCNVVGEIWLTTSVCFVAGRFLNVGDVFSLFLLADSSQSCFVLVVSMEIFRLATQKRERRVKKER